MSPEPSMRVMHVISGDLWAGAEVQAFTLLTSLRNVPGLEIHAVLMNDGELAGRLRAAGIGVQILDERRLGGLQILSGLRRAMREWRPDVVHTHRTKENVLGSVAALLSGRLPSVRTVHGASEHSPSLFERINRWCGAHLQDRLIAVSKDLAGKLAGIYPRERIVIIENGIDVAQVRAQIGSAHVREIAPDAFHVGIVGRLVPVKRIDLFLECAALLNTRAMERKFHFHVVGDGPLRATLAAQAERLGIGGIVTFHGHRPDSISVLAELDCLVMCSDHEGLPMTALEALAVGTPMIAHAVGGLVELLPAQALVHRHEASAYAEAVARLASAGLSAQAQPFPDAFSAHRNAAQVVSLYRQVTAGA